MDLNATKSGLLGELSTSAKVFDHDSDLVGLKRTRSLVFGILACNRNSLTHWDLDSRGRHNLLLGVVAGVTCATHVPKLNEDFSVLGVHAVQDLLPCSRVLVRVDSWCAVPATALFGDGGALGDDETSPGALFVVGFMQLGGTSSDKVCSGAGHWGHHYAVLENEIIGELSGVKSLYPAMVMVVKVVMMVEESTDELQSEIREIEAS